MDAYGPRAALPKGHERPCGRLLPPQVQGRILLPGSLAAMTVPLLVALVVAAVLVVVVGVLAWLVVSLRRRVDVLDAQLRAAADTQTPPVGTASQAASTQTGSMQVGSTQSGSTQTRPTRPGLTPVPVITALDTPDDVDLHVSRVAAVTFSGGLIKMSSLIYGLRRALSEDNRIRMAHAVRKEFKHQRKMRRRHAAHAGSRW